MRHDWPAVFTCFLLTSAAAQQALVPAEVVASDGQAHAVTSAAGRELRPPRHCVCRYPLFGRGGRLTIVNAQQDARNMSVRESS